MWMMPSSPGPGLRPALLAWQGTVFRAGRSRFCALLCFLLDLVLGGLGGLGGWGLSLGGKRRRLLGGRKENCCRAPGQTRCPALGGRLSCRPGEALQAGVLGAASEASPVKHSPPPPSAPLLAAPHPLPLAGEAPLLGQLRCPALGSVRGQGTLPVLEQKHLPDVCSAPRCRRGREAEPAVRGPLALRQDTAVTHYITFRSLLAESQVGCDAHQCQA